MENQYIEALSKLIKEVGERLLILRETNLEVREKPDGNIVTDADLTANEMIINFLAKEFPMDGIFSEEFPRTTKTRTWYIDPLNRTKEYLNGGSFFNIHISLVEDGVPTFGIIYHPADNRLYWGDKDLGAYMSINNIQSEIRSAINNRPSTKNKVRIQIPSDERYYTVREKLLSMDKYTLVHKNKSLYVDSKVQILLDKSDLYSNFASGNWKTWDIAPGHAILSSGGGRY